MFNICRNSDLVRDVFDSYDEKDLKTEVGRNWEEKTKNCKRDLLIKKIAVGIIAAVGVALCLTGLGLPLGGIALTGAAMIGVGTISITGFAALGMDWRDYSDPKTAKEVMEDIFNLADMSKFLQMGVSARVRTIEKIDTYVQYGFISGEEGKMMQNCLINAYKFSKNMPCVVNRFADQERPFTVDENNQNWNEVIQSIESKLNHLEEYISPEESVSKYKSLV